MIDQLNMWAFRCWANVAGERVAVFRAAGKLFQMTGPATTKLFILSVVIVLGTGSNPMGADQRCFLPAIAELARQSSAKLSWKRLWCHTEICVPKYVYPIRQKMNNVSIRQAISAGEAHYSHARAACDNSVIPHIRISVCIAITCGIRPVANNNTG